MEAHYYTDVMMMMMIRCATSLVLLSFSVVSVAMIIILYPNVKPSEGSLRPRHHVVLK